MNTQRNCSERIDKIEIEGGSLSCKNRALSFFCYFIRLDRWWFSFVEESSGIVDLYLRFAGAFIVTFLPICINCTFFAVFYSHFIIFPADKIIFAKIFVVVTYTKQLHS